MDLRNIAMAQLVFLTLWTTVCGPLSGLTMGLFFLVYRDGYRKGVLPPQGDRPLLGFLGAFRDRMEITAQPNYARMISRGGRNHR